MKIIKILSIIMIGIILHSCHNEEIIIPQEQLDFMKASSVGVYKEGMEHLIFDKKIHQMSYSQDMKFFRMQSDDQSQILQLDFEELPVLNKTVETDIKSEGVEELTSNKYTFKVVKNEGPYYWLYSDSYGLIVKIGK